MHVRKDMHIRVASVDDNVYLGIIDLKSYNRPLEQAEWYDYWKNPNKNLVVLTKQNKPVAFAGYEISGAQLKLNRLAVTPAERRQGLGAALLSWVRRLLEDRRIPRASCIVPADDLTACQFLRACGWKVPAKGGIMPNAFMDCGEPVEGLYFLLNLKGDNV